MALIVLLAFSFLLHGSLGEFVCENLPTELCSYSIASSGKRCLLENYATDDGNVIYQCKTTEVVVDTMKEWIESEECVKACGLDRNNIGISSDTLFQPNFLTKLCSNDCFQSCPNIIELYFNLALGEGAFLPDICAKPRRALWAAQSSGDDTASPTVARVAQASAPISSSDVGLDCAPTSM
ncbi:uncharacterized protein LOC126686628 [Mercurialis annua]|uniref:uncharacterized protein LOC126686628 n=1 Tax=Mercurialis annua TaxID=3986 RepID=UPI002160CAFC|nr:uncharacterized protein LOC126686628 [Mercurialis annua]